MNVEEAYNNWAEQYDTNENKTRDTEAIALRETLASIDFKHCLEIGCGTGKNTEWLIKKATTITAIDFSAEMLEKAKQKIISNKVVFVKADILQDWAFANAKKFDLVVFSLVLEHIEDLDKIFKKVSQVADDNSYVYIGEFHPFKQYTGSKARFETNEGVQILTCYNHHISDFINAAKNYGFHIVALNEYFDNNNKENIPRILALLFKKIMS